jgi:outer membrane immunogenic protein
MKTEYRAAEYSRINLPETLAGTTTLTGNSTSFKPIVQTVSTQLVYRFNWSGVGPKY